MTDTYDNDPVTGNAVEPGVEPEGMPVRDGALITPDGGVPAGSPSGVGAVIGPFFQAIVAPADCWRVLDARPVLGLWIALWVGVFTTALAIINMPITQQAMIAATRAQMRASGNEVSGEQLRQMEQMMTTFGAWSAYGSSLFMFLLIGLTALVIWVLAAIMGSKGSTFVRSFAVASAAATVRPLLYSLYVTIILQLNPPEIRRPEDVTTMTPSLGVDLLLSGPDTPTWLVAIFQRLDLFNLWWIALVVSGSVAVLKLSKGQGITVALIIWTIGTLIAAIGAFFQTLGG